MQLTTRRDIADDKYLACLLIKEYTCQEQQLIAHHGAPVISTGGEFATTFEEFATAVITAASLPTAGDTMSITADTTSTIEFVTNVGDAAFGNLEVVLPGTTALLAAAIAAVLPAEEYTITYTSGQSTVDLVRITAGDITFVDAATDVTVAAVAYIAPVDYFTLPETVEYMYEGAEFGYKVDTADLERDLNLTEADARLTAIRYVNLWIDEITLHLTDAIILLRLQDPNQFIATEEDTI